MTLLAIKYPVRLLYDARGIYGVGVVDRAVENDRCRPQDIILRPDRLLQAQTPHAAALQMIIGGFRHGMFSHMAEERLRQHIHWEMLRRKGLNWPPDRPKWWSDDSKQQARNRQIYHGLRLASLAVINSLVREALQAAAEPNALALARRFPFHQRYKIYRATAANNRAVQLTDVFPTLGLSIFGFGSSGANVNLVSEAKRLVEGGAPLRKIAELMGVPMAFRRVKPGAADLALSVVGACGDPRVVDAYLPDSLPMMKLWLRCLDLAKPVGPDFVEWTARHAAEIAGTPQETLNILMDLADWVRACHRTSASSHGRRNAVADLEVFRPGDEGEQFVVRPFSANMSLATVTSLSRDWHEAVAANMSGPKHEFPEPWCPAGRSGEFDVIPITTSAELYREGNLLHHCVGSYQGLVHAGESYIYSVRRDDVRVATLELRRSGRCIVIGQVRGACNVLPPKQVVLAVKSWVRSQREFRFAPEPERFPFVGERPERFRGIAEQPQRFLSIAQQLEFDFAF
jgi:PcfJ-like protein